MDFETSCWSAGSLANTAPTFYNPVQRRPKIDYFDSASITPIVSHISSNGYYGYIPTTHVPSTLVDLHSTNSPQKEQQQQQHQLNGNSMCYNDMVTMEMPNSEQSKHQGRSMIENRKRAVQSIADDFAAEHDVKRRRSHLSVIDYVEGLYLVYTRMFSTRMFSAHRKKDRGKTLSLMLNVLTAINLNCTNTITPNGKYPSFRFFSVCFSPSLFLKHCILWIHWHFLWPSL